MCLGRSLSHPKKEKPTGGGEPATHAHSGRLHPRALEALTSSTPSPYIPRPHGGRGRGGGVETLATYRHSVPTARLPPPTAAKGKEGGPQTTTTRIKRSGNGGSRSSEGQERNADLEGGRPRTTENKQKPAEALSGLSARADPKPNYTTHPQPHRRAKLCTEGGGRTPKKTKKNNRGRRAAPLNLPRPPACPPARTTKHDNWCALRLCRLPLLVWSHSTACRTSRSGSNLGAAACRSCDPPCTFAPPPPAPCLPAE